MHLFPIFITFSTNIEASISKFLYDTLLLPICMTVISSLPCSKCGVTYCPQSCIFAPLNDFIIHFAFLKELFSLFLLIFFK